MTRDGESTGRALSEPTTGYLLETRSAERLHADLVRALGALRQGDEIEARRIIAAAMETAT